MVHHHPSKRRQPQVLQTLLPIYRISTLRWTHYTATTTLVPPVLLLVGSLRLLLLLLPLLLLLLRLLFLLFCLFRCIYFGFLTIPLTPAPAG